MSRICISRAKRRGWRGPLALNRRAASVARSCESVMVGVFFFPADSFEYQKPNGQQRERLMVMPAGPRSGLVVRQTGFAFAALETLLDAPARLGRAREFG